jgi:hypothetical protein
MVICVLSLVCVQAKAGGDPAQAAVDSIEKALENYEVFKVKIVHVPDYVESRIRFDPKGLEKSIATAR